MKPTELLSLLRDRRAGVSVLQRFRQARESLRMQKVLEDFPPLKERRPPIGSACRQVQDLIDAEIASLRSQGHTPFDYSPEPIDDDEPDRNPGPFGEKP